MATYSAYKYNSSNNLMYRLDFIVNEIIPLSAEDIANNVSRVNWELNLYSFNNYAFSYHTLYWYIAIAGLEIEPNGYLYPAELSANSSITIASGTATIPHQTDGSKLAYCYAKLSTSSGSYMPGTMEATGNLKLTDVPRTSSVSCNSFNIGDSTTIVISRASDSFTHTLTWAFGNASGTIATKTSATTVGATIPASSLYAQIPNAKSGVGTITCSTYSGDTLIGTSPCNFTADAKESECIPTLSASIVDTNDTTIALTGSNTKFIKGFSNAKVTASAIAKNSASISSYLTSCGDGRTSSTAITQFNNINSKYISVKATDSRGYPKSVDYTLDWIEYIRLAFTSITVKRPESTADKANMTIKGNYFNNTFGNISNSLILQYRYKEGTGEYTDWTTLTPTITENTFTYTELLENLDHNKEYTFEFMIDDQLMTVYSDPVVLTKGIPILRVGEKYIKINGKIVPSANDCKNNIDANSLTCFGQYYLGENCSNVPASYVQILVLGGTPNNSSSGDCVQIAIPVSSSRTIYERYRNGSTWSDWCEMPAPNIGTIQGTDDFNNYKTAGIYQYGGVETVLNKPPTTWGIVEVISCNEYILQRTNGLNAIEQRLSLDGGMNWEAWKKISLT